MLKNQNGLCAICKQPEKAFHKKINKIRNLAVDHNHTTNKIRGLLCTNCNSAIGKFQDNINLLEEAIKYLKRDT